MKTIGIKQSRFELRLTEEEKSFFEKASQLAGYKTLSSFVISAIREYATKIIKEKEQILKSQKDKELFFDAVFSDIEPNDELKIAAKRYNEEQTSQ